MGKQLKEATVAPLVRRWLEHDGWSVEKGDDVDLRAYKYGDEPDQLVEVKGDQENDGATRNQFLMGLAQCLIAKARHPDARVTLALTSSFKSFVAKYVDALKHYSMDIIWVNAEHDISRDDLSSFSASTCYTEGGKRKRRVRPKRSTFAIHSELIELDEFVGKRLIYVMRRLQFGTDISAIESEVDAIEKGHPNEEDVLRACDAARSKVTQVRQEKGL